MWVVVSRVQVRARGGPEAGLAEPRLAGTREDDEENGGRKEPRKETLLGRDPGEGRRFPLVGVVSCQGARRTLNSAGAVCAT